LQHLDSIERERRPHAVAQEPLVPGIVFGALAAVRGGGAGEPQTPKLLAGSCREYVFSLVNSRALFGLFARPRRRRRAPPGRFRHLDLGSAARPCWPRKARQTPLIGCHAYPNDHL
jgi:hypothetical protein